MVLQRATRRTGAAGLLAAERARGRRRRDSFVQWPGAELGVHSATTLPAEFYTSEEVARVERSRVWGSGWLPCCLRRDVALAGARSTCPLLPEGPGHMPVFVTRDASGVLRAFKNLCSHRAHAVVTEDSRGGGGGCLSCGYHGWSYALDGRCIGAPRMDECRDFHLADQSLQELELCERGELVFVNVGDCAESFSSWIGDAPFVKRLETSGVWDGAGMRHVASVGYVVASNWKVFADNFLDGGYHVSVAHKQLSSGISMSSYESLTAAASGSSLQSVDASNSNSRLRGAKPAYAYIYPNLALNRYGPWLDVNVITPLAADRCHVQFEYWLQEGADDDDDEFIARSLRESDLVQMEDVAICESVQRGLMSGGYSGREGRYSTVEEPMHAFHRVYHASVAASTDRRRRRRRRQRTERGRD